jgi:hypothetical protein
MAVSAITYSAGLSLFQVCTHSHLGPAGSAHQHQSLASQPSANRAMQHGSGSPCLASVSHNSGCANTLDAIVGSNCGRHATMMIMLLTIHSAVSGHGAACVLPHPLHLLSPGCSGSRDFLGTGWSCNPQPCTLGESRCLCPYTSSLCMSCKQVLTVDSTQPPVSSHHAHTHHSHSTSLLLPGDLHNMSFHGVCFSSSLTLSLLLCVIMSSRCDACRRSWSGTTTSCQLPGRRPPSSFRGVADVRARPRILWRLCGQAGGNS